MELLPCHWRYSENQVKGWKCFNLCSQNLKAIVTNKMVFLLHSSCCKLKLLTSIYLFNVLYLALSLLQGIEKCFVAYDDSWESLGELLWTVFLGNLYS